MPKQGQPVGSVNLGDHIGKLETDALKLTDLLAELFTINRILQRHLENPRHDQHTWSPQ